MKIVSITLWLISGALILPFVFVAGLIYPLWSEWGEEFN